MTISTTLVYRLSDRKVSEIWKVVFNGVDLVKMNAMLLEQVEELTLYSIQLEKADQTRQNQLDQQQARLGELEKLVK